jgi:uncharacterized protein YodC (DUF2158 family)
MPCFDPINCGHPQCAAAAAEKMANTELPLRAGEIVQLKSGGPPVTVCEVVNVNKVAIGWYKEDDSLSVIVLPMAAFERVPNV